MNSPRTTLYGWLVAAAALFVAGVWLAPWAREQGFSWADLLYGLYDPVCHQQAGRSFHFHGHQVAVCHRCSGLYVGGLLGLALMPFLPRLRQWLLDFPRSILLFVLPLGIDWLLFSHNLPASRFLTGLVASFPIGAFAWAAARDLSSPERGPLAT